LNRTRTRTEKREPGSATRLPAVAACARALAGIENADSLLALSNAATHSGLRAFADRVVLQRRFHSAAIHQQHQPEDADAADLFDAVEQARLDALGAGWLPGIARNLIAHPGAENDGVRWLAFEVFSGQRAPREKRALTDGVRSELPSDLVAGLDSLRAHALDQEAFAAAAAAWVRAARAHVPRDPASASSAQMLELPLRYIDKYQRRGRYQAPTGSAGRSAPKDARQADGTDSAAPAGAVVEPTGREVGYRVFTSAHDRVVNAATLASRDELEQLRRRLDAELSATRTTVARLAKKLLRVLMARQVREWRFDRDEGLLDASRLAPMIASRGAIRPFKEETDSPFPSTVVTLLIDHSGSMRGRPMQIAALTVEIFVRVLERCNVKCEVLGFTTREWDGGAPGREWAAAGYPEHPGRLNALEHIVIKGADVPWRRARAGLGLFMRDEELKENIDGEALVWAHRRLLARSETRRILVVVSDGMPTDEATLAANGYDYLDAHLRQVIDDIESRSPVQLAAIGIGHDVSRFYQNATRIARVDDLGPALTAKLTALLGA
jgi:cobaltochelatase CobT